MLGDHQARRGVGAGWRMLGAAITCAAAGFPGYAAAQAGGREVNSFDLTPRVGVTYDSNVYQLNADRVADDRSDVLITPAVDASFTRRIGRNQVNLNADVGYSLYQRHSNLNQVVISATGNGTAALTAYCIASPTLSVSKQQNNLATGVAIRNSQTYQDYDVTVACQRPVGFYPSVTLGYQSVTNSQDQLNYINQHTLRVSGGIGYALPTVGSLLLSVGETRIRQPNRDLIEGIEDGSDTLTVGLTFNRAVAPRLSFSLGIRYLSVDPLRAVTRSFTGLGYNGSVNYHPSSRLSVVALASRDVTGSGDVAVSYVLSSNYSLTSTFTLTPRLTASAGVQYFVNDYRGENPIFFPILRGRERGTRINGNLSRSVGQRINIGLFAAYSTGDAQGTFYDYDRLQAGGTAGLRF